MGERDEGGMEGWRDGGMEGGEREVGERIYRVHVCVAICMSQYTNNSIILVCNTLYMCTIYVGLIVTCVVIANHLSLCYRCERFSTPQLIVSISQAYSLLPQHCMNF